MHKKYLLSGVHEKQDDKSNKSCKSNVHENLKDFEILALNIIKKFPLNRIHRLGRNVFTKICIISYNV